MSHDDCLLCTSPVPSNQDDANYAYLAGFVDGAYAVQKHDRASKLCADHEQRLQEMLDERCIRLEDPDKDPQRTIPAANVLVSFMHCARCMKQRPASIPPREWARIEVGFTQLGVQVRCARHNINIMHIDFQGARHPSNAMPTDVALVQDQH